jgi:hypothetical protein
VEVDVEHGLRGQRGQVCGAERVEQIGREGHGPARRGRIVELDAVASRTPLWFYILREAELNNGRLDGVGARIVAETFHRAMEGSRISIVLEPDWRPTLGPRRGTFEMTDLLFFAFGGRRNRLAPAG